MGAPKGRAYRQRPKSEFPALRAHIAHMRDVDGLTFAVIAKRVQLSANAVQNHYKRGIEQRLNSIYKDLSN